MAIRLPTVETGVKEYQVRCYTRFCPRQDGDLIQKIPLRLNFSSTSADRGTGGPATAGGGATVSMDTVAAGPGQSPAIDRKTHDRDPAAKKFLLLLQKA